MIDEGEFFDMTVAPMRIGSVRLKVRDLESIAGYYMTLLGLSEISRNDRQVVLGIDTTTLLVLNADRELAANDRRQAGLFHIAFLMPTRGDLARWLRHVSDQGIRLQGASDHIVSEALYLSDPEGNGIEVYVDRPVARWLDTGGKIQMSTDPLDVEGLLREAGDRTYAAFPEEGTIGHVHLQVGDTDEADRFYVGVLGMTSTVDYPGARFYGSGGYHHQFAGNVWNSRGASRRPVNMAGLDSIEVLVKDAADIGNIAARAERSGFEAENSHAGTMLTDPWGTVIVLKH